MPADKIPRVSVSDGVSPPDIFGGETGASAEIVAADVLLISKFAVSVFPKYWLAVILRSASWEVVDSCIDGVVAPSETLPAVDAAFTVASSELETLKLPNDDPLPPTVTEVPICVDKKLFGLSGTLELDKWSSSVLGEDSKPVDAP